MVRLVHRAQSSYNKYLVQTAPKKSMDMDKPRRQSVKSNRLHHNQQEIQKCSYIGA